MKRLPMRKIRDVLRLSAEGLSTRQIAASLAIGRTTLRGYLDRADELGLSWPLPPGLSDTDLERQIYPRTARDVSNRATQPDWAQIHRELRRKGVTLSLLWEEWHDVIGEPTFADAILDRIVHNAYRLELEGASMRKTIAKIDDETPQN